MVGPNRREMLRIISLLAICSFAGVQSASLETVSDEELINLIKTEKHVVVLFSKSRRFKSRHVHVDNLLIPMCLHGMFAARKDCEACDNFENVMIHLREDLVDSLSSWVIKAVDSQLLRLYHMDKEPALVFFRHGMPLLYDGANIVIAAEFLSVRF